MSHFRSRAVRALATISMGAATLAALPTASAAVAVHQVTPSVGRQPHYRLAQRDPAGQVVFTCQTRPVLAGGCYGPDQIRAAYDIQPLLDRGIDGTGRTIVIVDAFQSPTLVQDLHLFDSTWHLPDPALQVVAPDGLTPFDPGDDNMVGWSAEISLDVQWAHAIAPKARIVLVLAKSNDDADILSATQYAVDHNLGDVISQSFGEAEQCMDPAIGAAQTALFARATVKKITLIASSGDDGAAQPSCDGSTLIKAASTPASDPNVLAVGGTQLFADLTTGAYQHEVTWNEDAKYGAAGGGGYSILFKRPGYQATTVDSNKQRGVPDVAYNAGIDGGVIAFWGVPFGVGAAFRFGGTSAGAPQWSGLTALADQLGNSRVGLLNPTLYHLATNKNWSDSVHDITVGDNSFEGIQGFAATPGWDAATGLGTPVASKLVPLLAQRA